MIATNCSLSFPWKEKNVGYVSVEGKLYIKNEF